VGSEICPLIYVEEGFDLLLLVSSVFSLFYSLRLRERLDDFFGALYSEKPLTLLFLPEECAPRLTPLGCVFLPMGLPTLSLS